MINKHKKILTALGVLLISTLFSLVTTNTAHAEGILKKYASIATNKNVSYSELPPEVQKLIPNPPPASPASWDVPGGSYPYGQCTWYVYNRAKVMGREYDPYEGNGGVWMLKINPSGLDTGTEGDIKPVPQVAVSMQGGYDGIDAKYSSPLKNVWFFTTHVAYSEYIDSDGYLLMSESNVDGTTGHVLYKILTPDQAQNQNLFYVKPKNAGSIKDYGKNPDGSMPSTSGADGSKSKSKSDDSSDKKEDTDSGTNDKFIVNGYGSITAKDWKEANVSDSLPTQKDIDGLSSGQKQALTEWINEYSSNNDMTIVKTTRVATTLIGYMMIIFVLLLALAYAFDRVGVLEMSAVEFITSGKYKTVYSNEEARELKGSNLKVKPMNVQALAVVTLIGISIFVLITTGKIYEYSYKLYYLIYNISEYMNNIRPK